MNIWINHMIVVDLKDQENILNSVRASSKLLNGKWVYVWENKFLLKTKVSDWSLIASNPQALKRF